MTLGAFEGEKLLGIICVIGDKYTIIYIQDIIVDPEYQRKGIGTKLVKEILKRYKEVYQITLSTDLREKTVAFYKSLGFLDYREIGSNGFLKINI